MKRPSGQDSEEVPAPKRPKVVPELFDITPILKKRGGQEFYKERFFRWRRINGRDDPNQQYAAKFDSWKTFVRLENEHKMERLLQRGGKHPQERTPRSAVSDDDATGCSRTRERHREHQTPVFDEVPKCLRSVDNQATGPDRSAVASSDAASIDLDDQESTRQPSGDLREGQPTEVAANAKAIERLWKWKSAHRAQIAAHEERCATLEARCEKCESRCDDLETLVGEQASLIDALNNDLNACCAQCRDQVDRLQKNQEDRARQHDRLLAAVEEAGVVLQTQRREFDSRLRPLESVKEQAFDVLQQLHAEKQLHGEELTTLRAQVEKLQSHVERLRKNF